jgi:hypothetical protein
MVIFNVEIFGTDKEWFCNLTASEQVAWIKTNTNQLDDALINEFLSNSLHNRQDYCYTCRGNKQKISIAKIVENGNQLSRNAEEIETVVENNETSGNGKRTTNKRRGKS